VITAGRLWDPGKDVATLDRAAAKLQAVVFAAGPTIGPGGQSFHASNLTLLGSLDPIALARCYASAAVFAGSSVYEPFGLAALEAAQSGAALVLSNIPTFRELWGGAAVFFPPRRADLLAAAVSRVLEDIELRHKLAQLAESRAKRFSVARMVSGTLSVYVSQIARMNGRRRPARAA
jgi:glycosyltransferase involved in cell wall biosynthesis